MREPLVHFFILGAALFALFSWVNRGEPITRDEIVVDAPLIEHLVARFERTWQRPPDPEEQARLIDQWVRDEILYREGVRLGLDRGDSVIRRRMAQKVDTMADVLASGEPTDADLQAWFEQHAERYRIGAQITFRQVYFDPDRYADPGQLDLAMSSARDLLLGDPAATVGDATMLPQQQEMTEARQIAGIFGEQFANALEGLQPGEWSQPLRSAFGWHLVLVNERREGSIPPFEQVRDAVALDLRSARSAAARENYYESVRQRFVVRVEDDSPAARQQ